MSSISKTGPTQQVARTRALEARGRLKTAQDAAPGIDLPQAPPSFDFEDDLARRVAAISSEEPGRHERVVGAFLQSCVARTFGSAAPSDPAFARIIEQTRQAIASDAALAAAMDRLVERLASAPPQR